MTLRPIPDFENNPSLTERQKHRRREYYANREENIRKTAEWQKAHPDVVKAYGINRSLVSRARKSKLGTIYARAKYPEKKEFFAEYRKTEAFKKSMRKHCLKLKRQTMDAYGGHCSCCGENRIEFLSLDHIYNDGGEERRNGGTAGGSWYRRLRNQGYPQGRLQVLCLNCNGAKAYYGICPHEFEAKKLLGIHVVAMPVIKGKRLSG